MKSPVLPTKGKIMLYLSMLKTMLQIKQILVTLLYYVNQNLLLELLSLSALDSGRAVARAVPDGDLRCLYLVRPLPQTPWRNPAAVSGHKVFTHAFAEGYDASLRSATRPNLSHTLPRGRLGPSGLCLAWGRALPAPGGSGEPRARRSLRSRDAACHLRAEPSLCQPEKPGVSRSCS